jgi:hypothetical protein
VRCYRMRLRSYLSRLKRVNVPVTRRMPITRKLNGRGVAISVPARNGKTKAAVDVNELEPIRLNVDEVPTARGMGITCELDRSSVVIGVPARNGKTKAAIHVFDLDDIAAHGGKAPGTRRNTFRR